MTDPTPPTLEELEAAFKAGDFDLFNQLSQRRHEIWMAEYEKRWAALPTLPPEDEPEPADESLYVYRQPALFGRQGQIYFAGDE